MKRIVIKAIAAIFVIFVSNSSNALQLDIEEAAIEFKDSAEPIIVKLRVIDNGKLQRWDTKKLSALSSKIVVKDSKGNSLGRDSSSGLRFVPNGTSADRLAYNLVAVVDRTVAENSQFVVFISILNRPELSDMVVVDVSKLSMLREENDLGGGLSDSSLKESISELESKVTNLVYGLVLALLMFSIPMFLVLRKSDTVTEKVGGDIRDRQMQYHYEFMSQGKDLLSSSERINADTETLKVVTSRMDNDIRDFTKNPEKYKHQIENDLKKLKKLIESVSSDSEHTTDSFSNFLIALEHEKEASDAKITQLSQSVDYFVRNVESYHSVLMSIENYISNIEFQSYEARREAMRDEVNEIFMELERTNASSFPKVSYSETS